ncbi:MAG: ABC transporter permease [Mameliella sp.]|nr:ABC transporter permease [Mameliella sp.]|tara:strand:+ start:6410 stop:7288 length:879 start_codon:yes stop_codon:yes gene_type:complete
MTRNENHSVTAAEQPFLEGWRVFRQNKAALSGLIILGFILLITAVGPSLYGVDPYSMIASPLIPPLTNPNLPLGTDFLGRDVVAGLINGGRVTILIGCCAASITVIIGLLVGAFAGFYGKTVDDVLMRVTEFFQVLPALLFAMALVTLFSPSVYTIIVAIGLVVWPQTARLARAEFMQLRNLEYVASAKVIGSSNTRIIWRVILPNAMPPLIVSATLAIGVSILFESGLSFLGLGDANVMSWGLMIGQNRPYLLDGWWTVTFPGFAIFLTVLSVSLIGDGLNDALNPKLRER